MNENRSTLLQVRDLRVWFPITSGVFARTIGHVKAVDGVSLEIQAGQTVGLVGESGCGKTTLGRAILGLERPCAGQVFVHGVDLTTLSESARRPFRREMQIIFQDPVSSLNPRLTVIDLITEGLLHYNAIEHSKEEDAAFWLKEVGMDERALFRYPHEFSGGQRQRIAIARAISLRPKFIVCDEAVSALDVSVQAQVINLLRDLSQKYQVSYLFITHDLSVVRHISQSVAVMYLGHLVEFGPTTEVIANPLHPYTQALISAIPRPGQEKGERIILEGDIPSPSNPPPGCPFHTRCRQALPLCRQQRPRLKAVGPATVACHLFGLSC